MKGRNRQFNNPEEMERQMRDERENWRVSLLEGENSHKIIRVMGEAVEGRKVAIGG